METDALAGILRVKVESLQAELLAKVAANLSGDVLQERSGTLKASIVSMIEDGGGSLTAKVASTGVAYAAIQEHGGVTPAHEILPVKTKALAIAGGVFARRTMHPGSVIPARAYLGGALDALRDDISGGPKQAVRAALAAA